MGDNDDKVWDAVVGLLRFTHLSSGPLGLSEYPAPLQGEIQRENALDLAKHQVVWILSSIAFQLRRAEEGHLPGTLRMKITSHGRDVRSLDEKIDPIDGWILTNDGNGFLSQLPTEELPCYFFDTPHGAVKRERNIEKQTIWETAASFYSTLYSRVTSLLPEMIDSLYNHEAKLQPQWVARCSSAITLAVTGIYMKECCKKPNGIQFDVELSNNIFHSARPAINKLQKTIGDMVIAKDFKKYLDLWETDMLERF